MCGRGGPGLLFQTCSLISTARNHCNLPFLVVVKYLESVIFVAHGRILAPIDLQEMETFS